jgi:hypothetical protein
MNTYKTETLTQHGKTYRIEWVYDECHGAPWEESDGHGIVSDWVSRDKKPGELVLNSDRGLSRFYDYAATIEKAKAEGWGISDPEGKTKAQIAAEAVMQDFKYLHKWCNDEWHYCGIVVTVLDDDGEETDNSASLWGIEDDGYCSRGYHATVIQDLIGECEYQEMRSVYPVTTCGV